MARIDSGQIRELISQNFGNAQASGRLGEHSAQIGPAQAPRAQPSESGFTNKAKNLLDRAVTFIRSTPQDRAEAGITRGVQNLDKALGKLLDAMKPDGKGDIDFAKLCRRLDALPGSAKSATSRGVDYKELLEERLKQCTANLDPQALDGAHENNLSALQQLKWENVRIKNGGERQTASTRLEQLETLSNLFAEAKSLALKKYVSSIIDA